MASSVDVSVEALQECIVQEITLEGQEIYVSYVHIKLIWNSMPINFCV